MHRAAITPRERPAHAVVIALTALVVLRAAEVRQDILKPAGQAHRRPPVVVQWPGKYFGPAVNRVAEDWPDEHGELAGATPYSLRLGMISLRIRADEDRQEIAKQCGTSVVTLELRGRDRGPRGRGSQPAVEERIRPAARSCRQAPSAVSGVSDARAHRRGLPRRSQRAL
jgi:hypothetical protein